MNAPTNMTSKERFKGYLRSIGSGHLTGKGLSREEAADALHLMLTEQASSAQIGAFLIAHRIRRPEPQELAGMVDTYLKLGPKISSIKNQRRPICFGMPFDGRSKTAPIYPITSLLLLSMGQPIILQGGNRMPVKYGITTIELFKALGLNLEKLSKELLQKSFNENGFALIHQPDHFPLAENLVKYRDEIGKRPPIASMELIWTAHNGEHLLISGFVHPPTEDRSIQTLQMLGEKEVVTIKGLEGSTDLPTNRPCITSKIKSNQRERIILHPRDYQCHKEEKVWQGIAEWSNQAIEALNNQGCLKTSVQWNTGIYLWFAGITSNLQEGLDQAEASMSSGVGQKILEKLISWRNGQEA